MNLPIGYQPFHRNKFLNCQLNRWYSLGYARLEDIEQVGHQIRTFEDYIHSFKTAFGEMIFNCTAGAGSMEALKMAGADNLNGKTIVDIANPLDFSKGMPPSLSVCNTDSLGETIQNAFPDVKVVKALNTMWCGIMVNPGMINGGDHNTFSCGNDAEAKAAVKEILQAFGWAESNILDLGDITKARGTEMYLPIWLSIYGATNNGAFNIKIVS